MVMHPLGQIEAQAVHPQQSCGSEMMICRISFIAFCFKVAKLVKFPYICQPKKISLRAGCDSLPAVTVRDSLRHRCFRD